jgi:hypothetical protein
LVTYDSIIVCKTFSVKCFIQKRIEWNARVGAWKSSGLSVAEWWPIEGVVDHKKYCWIRIFEGGPVSESNQDAQWLTVNIQNEPTSHHVGEESVLFMLVNFLLK